MGGFGEGYGDLGLPGMKSEQPGRNFLRRAAGVNVWVQTCLCYCLAVSV